jgi:carboxymethylenebutenolidase
MGEMIEFPSNGSSASGYLAVPAGGDGPGVVVIQEWWGLVDHITDVCDRFAGEGFVALAPDLYHGAKTSEPDEAAKTMMALRLDQAARDMSGAVDAVAARSSASGVGVVGFCMGGGLALMLASQRPDKVRAVVPFYGVVPWQGAQPDYSALSAAVLGHYAGRDESASPEAARALARTLEEAGNGDVEIHVYDQAEHAFFNDTRPEVYDADAAELAWRRTTEFLHSRLG